MSEQERIRELEEKLAESESWRKTWKDTCERLDAKCIKLEMRLHVLIGDVDGIIEDVRLDERRRLWIAAKEKP